MVYENKLSWRERSLLNLYACMQLPLQLWDYMYLKKTMIESLKFQSKRLKFKHKCKIVCLNHEFSLLNPFVKKNPSGL